MKKVLILATLMAVVVFFASGQSNNQSGVEAQIRRLNSQEVDALLRNDVKTLARLWSDDFVVTNPFNKFINKKQVLAMVESGSLAFTSYERQIEYVRVYGNTAVVAGAETVEWAGKMPIAGQTSQLRITSVWMKRDGNWQQVARHANMVVRQ